MAGLWGTANETNITEPTPSSFASLLGSGTVPKSQYEEIVAKNRYAYILSCFLGAVGSALNILVYVLQKTRKDQKHRLQKSKDVHLIFLAGVCLGDLVYTVSKGVTSLTGFFMMENLQSRQYMLLCLETYTAISFRRAAVCVNSLAALERFLAIAFPFGTAASWFRRFPATMVGSVLVANCVAHTYMFLEYTVKPFGEHLHTIALTDLARRERATFNGVKMGVRVVFFYIPLSSSLLVNVALMVALRKHAQQKSNMRTSRGGGVGVLTTDKEKLEDAAKGSQDSGGNAEGENFHSGTNRRQISNLVTEVWSTREAGFDATSEKQAIGPGYVPGTTPERQQRDPNPVSVTKSEMLVRSTRSSSGATTGMQETDYSHVSRRQGNDSSRVSVASSRVAKERDSSSNTTTAEQQAARLIIVLTLTFFFLALPSTVNTTAASQLPGYGPFTREHYLYSVLLVTLDLPTFLTQATLFVLNIAFGRGFRDTVVGLVCAGRWKRRSEVKAGGVSARGGAVSLQQSTTMTQMSRATSAADTDITDAL